MIDCTQIPPAGVELGNNILCQGINELALILDNLNTFFTADSVYFFLGVICGLAFISGVKMRL